jgi:hypothetical protein
VFRRSSSTDSTDSAAALETEPAPQPGRPATKGRPTPSRKEAEAAARLRAKPPRTRKEQAAARRAARTSDSKAMRDALRTGNERALPARDKGPMKRFIRDYVDVRFSFIELLMPLMLLVLLMGLFFGGNQTVIETGNMILIGTVVLAVLDGVFLRLKIRREFAVRFPGESTKGTTYYALMRAMQVRFLRLPKPQKKIGQQLDGHYR